MFSDGTCKYCGEQINFRQIEGRRTPIHVDSKLCQGFETNTFQDLRHFERNAKPQTCKCGSEVFYVEHNNGKVYFDKLGWPWPKHSCQYTSKSPGPSSQSKKKVDSAQRTLPGKPGEWRICPYCESDQPPVKSKNFKRHVWKQHPGKRHGPRLGDGKDVPQPMPPPLDRVEQPLTSISHGEIPLPDNRVLFWITGPSRTNHLKRTQLLELAEQGETGGLARIKLIDVLYDAIPSVEILSTSCVVVSGPGKHSVLAGAELHGESGKYFFLTFNRQELRSDRTPNFSLSVPDEGGISRSIDSVVRARIEVLRRDPGQG